MPADRKTKTTIITLRRHKKVKEKTCLVTAYDYPQSLIADKAGVDIILVGDSCGMTTHGYKTTIPVTMREMINHCEAVSRGSKDAFLIGDMPFMSYQASNKTAVKNAGKFIIAGMDCIKVEGAMINRVKAIVDSGIIVMSHLGLTPHTRAKLGGYRVQGKTAKHADVILEQALRLQDAGCSFLLLEAMPTEPAGIIAERLEIPVYGIGAGDRVDGQLVILHDLIGLFWDFKSKFVKRYCDAGKLIESALKEYKNEVKDQIFPSEENFYKIKEAELEKMVGDTSWKYEKDRVENLASPSHSVTPKNARDHERG